MSISPLSGPYTHTLTPMLGHPALTAAPAERAASSIHLVRRRPTARQGHALETLGHAIEYLVDSQLYASGSPTSNADVEARQILMRLSREIFAECAIAVPVRPPIWSRLRRLLSATAGGAATC